MRYKLDKRHCVVPELRNQPCPHLRIVGVVEQPCCDRLGEVLSGEPGPDGEWDPRRRALRHEKCLESDDETFVELQLVFAGERKERTR